MAFTFTFTFIVPHRAILHVAFFITAAFDGFAREQSNPLPDGDIRPAVPNVSPVVWRRISFLGLYEVGTTHGEAPSPQML